MSKADFAVTYIEALDMCIPAFINASIANNMLDEMGDETSYVFFSVAKEYYLYGTTDRVLRQVRSSIEEDFVLMKKLLDLYILLDTNQNLLEMTVNRIRLLNYCLEHGYKYDLVDIKKLNLLMRNIEGKSTFNILPISVLKRTRFQVALETILNGTKKSLAQGHQLPDYNENTISMTRVRKVLKSIKT